MQVPRTVEEISPDWLTHALREGGVLQRARVTGARNQVIGDGKGFLSCVARVELEYDDREAGAPASVVVKLEPGAGSFREMGDELHAFEREIRFYREVAPSVPCRLARLWFAAAEPPDFAMVMEDLSFARPGDQVAGMHSDKVRATVRALGKLQAHYWGNEQLAALHWMPDSNEAGADFDAQWPSFAEHFGHYIGPKGRALGKRLLGRNRWLEGEMAARPRTIVHCDLRADNLMFGEPGSAEEVIIIDWQVAVRGMGAFDVARLLGGSAIPRERTGHHLEILRVWHDSLVAEGVADYAWDEAVHDFRLGALAVLFYPVHFHRGMIRETGRPGRVMEAICRRLFSTAIEVDAASLLP